MILIQDDSFSKEDFKELQNFCNKVEFVKYPVGDKEFLMANTPEKTTSQLKIEGYKIILSFIRKAHNNFDTDWRIHSDGIIGNQKTVLASVLYINDSEKVSKNGTAFWKHKIYGHFAPENISNEEFDRLLKEDSNDLKKWDKTSYIDSIPNRLLIYPANHFHSKYPRVIKEGERIVCVTFYAKI